MRTYQQYLVEKVVIQDELFNNIGKILKRRVTVLSRRGGSDELAIDYPEFHLIVPKSDVAWSLDKILEKFKDGTYDMIVGDSYGYKYISPNKWMATDGSIVKKNIASIIFEYAFDAAVADEILLQISDMDYEGFCKEHCRKLGDIGQAEFEGKKMVADI